MYEEQSLRIQFGIPSGPIDFIILIFIDKVHIRDVISLVKLDYNLVCSYYNLHFWKTFQTDLQEDHQKLRIL